jgi:hypothetical protein
MENFIVATKFRNDRRSASGSQDASDGLISRFFPIGYEIISSFCNSHLIPSRTKRSCIIRKIFSSAVGFDPSRYNNSTWSSRRQEIPSSPVGRGMCVLTIITKLYQLICPNSLSTFARGGCSFFCIWMSPLGTGKFATSPAPAQSWLASRLLECAETGRFSTNFPPEPQKSNFRSRATRPHKSEERYGHHWLGLVFVLSFENLLDQRVSSVVPRSLICQASTAGREL